MRGSMKHFAGLVASAFDVGAPIYEFGSLQVPGQEGYADLRPNFPGKEYIGCDMREGPGVDRIADLHDLDLPAECAQSILCFDTLEHVEFPHRAMAEMHRVLCPGGLLAISSTMNWPVHDHPHDFWRFTPEAFRSMLRPFAASWVGSAGDPAMPHAVVGVAFKGPAPPMDAFLAGIPEWQQQWQCPHGERRKVLHAKLSTHRFGLRLMFEFLRKRPRA